MLNNYLSKIKLPDSSSVYKKIMSMSSGNINYVSDNCHDICYDSCPYKKKCEKLLCECMEINKKLEFEKHTLISIVEEFEIYKKTMEFENKKLICIAENYKLYKKNYPILKQSHFILDCVIICILLFIMHSIFHLL